MRDVLLYVCMGYMCDMCVCVKYVIYIRVRVYMCVYTCRHVCVYVMYVWCVYTCVYGVYACMLCTCVMCVFVCYVCMVCATCTASQARSYDDIPPSGPPQCGGEERLGTQWVKGSIVCGQFVHDIPLTRLRPTGCRVVPIVKN